MEEELSSFLIVYTTWRGMEGQYDTLKTVLPKLLDIFLQFWAGSVVFSPVTFRSNSPLSTFGFSFLPKILSPNVLSLVLEIGNVINKTPVIPNKTPVKDAAIISPGIWIFFHMFMIIPMRI